VRLRLVAPPPSVTVIQPNVTTPGGTVVAFGRQIPVAGAALSATVADRAASILRTERRTRRRHAPVGSTLGAAPDHDGDRHISPTIPTRSRRAVTVVPGPTFTPNNAPSVVTFPCAIRGWHSRLSPRRFAVALAPGDELVAETSTSSIR
jgi:hypothetical protein